MEKEKLIEVITAMSEEEKRTIAKEIDAEILFDVLKEKFIEDKNIILGMKGLLERFNRVM